MRQLLNRHQYNAGRLALIAGGLVLAIQLLYFLFGLATWMDEGNYLYGSTACIRHGLKLYSEQLPCWYTPLYYVALGCWQEIAGLGLRPSRLFSVLCFTAALVILIRTLAGRDAARRQAPAAVFVWLTVLSPAVALYHASVSQFSFVNVQIAAVIWVLFHPSAFSRDLRWLGAGVLTGTILMTRPNYLLIVPLLIVADAWLHGLPGRRAVASYLIACASVDILICAIFGPGAFWNLIRTYPGAEGLAKAIGLTADPAVGSLEGGDLGLQVQSWWATRPETFRGPHEWFIEGVLWPYLPLLLANLFTLFRWRQRGYDRSLDAAFALVFATSVGLHFAATQTFCQTCAMPYVNYSVIFGLAGGAQSSWIAWERLRDSFPAFLHARSWRSWTHAGAALAITLTFLPSLVAFTAGGVYRKWIDFKTPGLVRALATNLAPQVPPDAVVLPLGIDIRLTEAIHLAERLADPLLINFSFSLRDPIETNATFSEAEQARIRARGLWTKELLRDWLREQHRYVIYREGGVIDVRCKEILAECFVSQPLVPSAAPGSPLSGYRLATRQSPKPSTTTAAR